MASDTLGGQAGAALGGYPSGPCRELYFHERSLEQKIDKIAEVLEYLALQSKECQEALSILRVHSHAGNRVTVPLDSNIKEASWYLKNPLGRERKNV